VQQQYDAGIMRDNTGDTLALSMFESDCGSARTEHIVKHVFANVNAWNSASGQLAS
jgi:hypothetical protein